MRFDHDIQIASIEGFLRRAGMIDAPFMAKGSIISRQYFPERTLRYAADLDWVYLDFIDDDMAAGPIFSDWVTQVTEIDLNDGVKFRSFRENDFWRRIDYAMHDDFPTVDTDLLCWVDGVRNDRLGLDISYNLDIDYPPVELRYQPKEGTAFHLKKTCPFPLQISWKLHQLLVRPRLKDVFDLIHLLAHPAFTEEVQDQTIRALKKECARDGIRLKTIKWYLDGRLAEYFEVKDKPFSWRKNQLKREMPDFKDVDYLTMVHTPAFTPVSLDHKTVADLLYELQEVLEIGGFSRRLEKAM